MTTTADQAVTTTFSGAALVRQLRDTFATGRTRTLEWRLAQLDGLARMFSEREPEIIAAVQSDLGRSEYEAWFGDVGSCQAEIAHTRKHVKSWMKPERAPVPGAIRPARARIVPEPLGAVLIISPWNYPVYLAIAPLAAALAAGNTVAVKPSEVSPASSAILARLLPEYLDADAIAVVEGGVAETTDLLEQRWDHILYTGGPTVGRIVAAAAAKHLTPVTLELGGKTPTIIHKDANLKQAARRVAFAKFCNAGQTCIATDYVYVHKDVENEFAELLTTEVKERYGDDPKASPDYGRIINENHAARLAQFLEGGFERAQFGGTADVNDKYIAPTLLRGIQPGAKVMEEEIFGPILPLLTYTDLDEPINAINAGEKPLALYVFSKSDAVAKRVLSETSSGGACVNEVMMHIMVSDMPFGGVGESGYGAYHGKTGFDTFSHRKSVLRRPSWMPELPAARAPYAPWKLKMMKKFL
jgi:aldehyde dehydrogenase (NAD+)